MEERQSQSHNVSNRVHFAHNAIVYYLEFKLRYLKNMKLFSTRVKELFDPIVLREKKPTGFNSIFLKALFFFFFFFEKPTFE